jgi:circadian clock protein KaiC
VPVKKPAIVSGLPKARSGIRGLDEITGGGLPRGRPTLVCGNPGAGKTLFSVEFLVRGIEMGEPGVFVSFEETAEELAQNVASLGFDLDRLCARKKLLVDFVRVERAEIEETGEYDLEGLFVRLGHAIDAVSAKRVVLDTIESLFAGLSNANVLRAELRRLFRWLKARRVTAVVTAERGVGALTRQGLEEYVSDCVILLDHRVTEQVSTRRLRVVKYRGSAHGTNEYPFLIDDNGFSVLPITSLGLHHRASAERVSSGIPQLDSMLGGGYFRGSTVLVSGTAGSGKTSVAARLRARGALPVFRVRGISAAARAQHELDRHGSGPVAEAGPAAAGVGAAGRLRAGDASGLHAQDDPGVPTRGRPRGSHH